MEWFSNNLGNIIVILALAALLFVCARSLIRQKKTGNPSCATCGCSGSCLHSQTGQCQLKEALKK